MTEFHGDLLIGGMRLKHLAGELDEYQRQPNASDWLLTGHFHLSADQAPHLELGRVYRLLLEDGRAGQVVLSRIEPSSRAEFFVDFGPGYGLPSRSSTVSN